MKLYVREAGEYREARAQVVLDRANAIIAQRFRAGAPVLSSPSRTHEYLRFKLGALEHEMFSVLMLDSRGRLIEYVELFRGTVDSAAVYPREVVKEALARNAKSLILVHCHPSADPSPSKADETITRRVRDAAALLDLNVHDHIVIAGTKSVSFAELGLL